jgi:hypothetical protein
MPAAKPPDQIGREIDQVFTELSRHHQLGSHNEEGNRNQGKALRWEK